MHIECSERLCVYWAPPFFSSVRTTWTKIKKKPESFYSFKFYFGWWMLCTDATLDCRDFTAGGIFVFPFFLRQTGPAAAAAPTQKIWKNHNFLIWLRLERGNDVITWARWFKRVFLFSLSLESSHGWNENVKLKWRLMLIERKISIFLSIANSQPVFF